MKHFQKRLTALLAVLLVICFALTSCAGTKPNETDTTGTPETEGHTHPSDTTGAQAACTHATTTLVGKKDATCAAEGYTGDTVCSACGEIVATGSAIQKKEHTWDNGVPTKNPTCIETGVLTITCAGCGDTKTQTLPTVEHKDEYHDALDGTHNHTCSTCTMNENEQHTPVDAGVFYPATCLEGAYTLMTCADCGGTYKVYSEKEEDKATGHQWGDWVPVSEATCTATGKKTRTCSCCPATEEFVIPVDTTAHSFVRTNPNVAATCGESATAEYICEHCQASKTETLPATGKHDYVEQDSTGDGWTRHVCSVCGDEIAKFDAKDVTVAEVDAKDIPTDTTLAIETKKASISLPANVVSQLVEDTSKKVSIAADVVEQANKDALLANASNLNEAEKERLKDVDIFDFGITVGDTAVSQFCAAVTVTLPYTLKEGEEPDGIIIWYVADDGTLEEVEAVYDAETQTVTFSVEHFSFYAVAYKETQAMRCKNGNHEYEAVETVSATCETHGYTVYECTGCHKRTVDNFVEKAEHSYGELHEANPTCTEGDWSYKECQNCGHVLNVTFVRANGHTPDGVATCTTPSTCTTCHTVITAAKGHSFTEWETVVEPTDVNSGLRRRYCLSCGKMEEMKLAASGNIEQLKFESYEQLLEAIFQKVFNLENGTIHLDAEVNGYGYIFDVTVNSDEDDFLMLVEAKQTQMQSDSTAEETLFTLLYRNGVIIYSDGTDALQTDLDALLQLPFDVWLDYVEQEFEFINPMAEELFAQAKELLETYTALLGTQLNAILQAAGSEYTVEDLNQILASAETVYAYCALKMGYHTNLEMQDGVRIPTQADWHTVLTALMTPNVNADGNTTYTWEVSELLNAVNALLDWVKENKETAYTDLLYALIADSLTNPDLTDWDACVANIKTILPGTLTVKEMVDRTLTILEQEKICTADELYDIINQLAEQITGDDEFDIESMLEACADMTLNDLACTITGSEGVTMESLIDALNKQLSGIKFGDINLGSGMTVASLAEAIENVLAGLHIDADVSITLDQKGYLLGVNVNGSVLAGGATGTELGHLVFRVTQDETATITTPEAWKPLTDQTVSSVFDANGNLIVGGLNSNMEYSFTIDGKYYANVKDLMTKDEDASTSFGFPVYTLPKSSWDNEETVQEVVVIDGKYYLLEDYTQYGSYTVLNSYTLAEFLSNPDDLLPNGNSVPAGVLYEDRSISVYETAFGIMWLSDEQWMYSNDYSTYTSTSNGETLIKFSPYDWAPYQTYEDLVLYSMSSSYSDIEIDGQVYELKRIRLATADAYDETVFSVYGYTDDDGNIHIINRHYNSSVYGYVLGEQIEQLEDYDDSYEYYTTITLFDKKGESSERVTVQKLVTYKKLPTFYTKVDSDNYVEVGYLTNLSNAQLSEYEQIKLANGQTLYCLPKEMSEYVAGYVKTESGKYIPTVVKKDFDGALTSEVIYRSCIGGQRRVSFDDMFETAQYVTANTDGTFTVSAQLIKLLGEKCTVEGDGYTLLLVGKLTDGESTFTVRHSLMSQRVPETLSFGGSSNAEVSRWIDWSEIFGYNYGSDDCTVTLNKDGSLTIAMTDGTKITGISYSAYGGSVALDDFLVYNEDMSKQTGAEIYGNLFRVDDDTHTAVLIDGKYYDYTTIDEYTAVLADSLEEAFGAMWSISSMYLRYWIETDEQSLPVYELDINLQQINASSYFTCFAAVKDGQLYILKQAQELGESVLQYEALVPIADYFASLKPVVESDDSYNGPKVIVNGTAGKLYGMWCTLYETDANGEILLDEDEEPISLTGFTIWVFVDDATGQQHLLGKATYVGSHLQLDDEYTPAGILAGSYDWTEDYLNGTYTFVSLHFAQYKYLSFIRIAGQLYRYDDYRNNYYTPDQFLWFYGDKQWVYAVVDADMEFDVNGDWIALDGDGNEVEKPEGWLNVSSTLFWTKDDGQKVYEISGYVIATTVLEDGTVLYGEPGELFVQGPDGNFIWVYLETDNDGVEHAVCGELESTVIDGYDMQYYHLLEKYATFTADGKLLLSADAAALLESFEEFRMYVETEDDSHYVGDIREYFEN